MHIASICTSTSDITTTYPHNQISSSLAAYGSTNNSAPIAIRVRGFLGTATAANIVGVGTQFKKHKVFCSIPFCFRFIVPEI